MSDVAASVAIRPLEIPAFRDLAALVKWLKFALVAFLLATMINAYSNWLQIVLLVEAQHGARVAANVAAANDFRQRSVGFIYFLAYLATAIVFLRWTFLTKRNAIALRAHGLAFSPGWAVGWYFVPIFTLWKPYQALKETYQASHPEFLDNWSVAPYPKLLSLWWAIWIITCLVGQLILRGSLLRQNVAELLATTWVNFLSTLLDIALVGVVWVLISTLQKWQTAKAGRVGPTAEVMRSLGA